MAEKLEIPVETKYQITAGALADAYSGFVSAIRKKYGAEAAREVFEIFCKEGDRAKNMTNTLKDAFKIEGNDAETIAKWHSVFWEITGIEGTLPELSKKRSVLKVTKCPFKTEHKDIGTYTLAFDIITAKTINPKATWEIPKAMCAGDPYCEHVIKIEE